MTEKPESGNNTHLEELSEWMNPDQDKLSLNQSGEKETPKPKPKAEKQPEPQRLEVTPKTWDRRGAGYFTNTQKMIKWYVYTPDPEHPDDKDKRVKHIFYSWVSDIEAMLNGKCSTIPILKFLHEQQPERKKIE